MKLRLSLLAAAFVLLFVSLAQAQTQPLFIALLVLSLIGFGIYLIYRVSTLNSTSTDEIPPDEIYPDTRNYDATYPTSSSSYRSHAAGGGTATSSSSW